jgi:ubiquinol-cytochrome c reductase cytochrome b subunit
MNKLGSAGAPGSGSFLVPDPEGEQTALVEAAHASEHRAITALKERQNGEGTNGNGNGSNGQH